MTDKLPRTEVVWCSKALADMGCNGYSDGCPPKMQKYFVSERGIPKDKITFIAPPIIQEPDLP